MLPDTAGISGLGMMGGAMSVNDALPWMGPMLHLIRAAVASRIPVLGHCLGGQLLSRALGGEVRANPVKEIGWAEIEVVNGEVAGEWGPGSSFTSFQWHGETFSIPRGATRIWASAHCANQAFVTGNSIGMQPHIEMTVELVETWCAGGAQEIEQGMQVSPAVQSADQMRAELEAKVERLHRVADAVYGRWVRGLIR